MLSTSRFFVLFTLLAMLSTSATSRTQDKADAAAPGKDVNAPQPSSSDMSSIQSMLPHIVWNAQARGALIIVDPGQQYKRVNTPSVAEESLPGSLESFSNGISVRDVARRFSLRLVPLGSVTTLAPETMMAINSSPRAGDIFSHMGKDQKLRLILASLTPAQWQMLGSETGLGASDLPPDLQEAFVSLFPAPLVYRAATYEGDADAASMGKPVTVGEEQRHSLRLRVSRRVYFSFPIIGRVGASLGTDLSHLDRRTKFQIEPQVQRSQENSLFGVAIKTFVPNRLKPSQINWESPELASPVALAGMKTIGDLIDKIAATTRADIRADSRLRGVPIALIGETGLSRDLLKALCWGTMGAIRRLEGSHPIYILTDDVEGLGVRMARLSDWADTLTLRLNQAEEKSRQKIYEVKPKRFLNYRTDDPAAPTADFLKKIETEKKKQGSYAFLTMSTNDLPAALATSLREAAAQMTQGDGSHTVNSEQITFQENYVFSYVLPGIGVLETDRRFSELRLSDWDLETPGGSAGTEIADISEKWSMENATKPIVSNLVTRALLIAPRTVEDTKLWVQRAKSAHVTHVFVQLEGGESDMEILKTAVAAGKRLQIPVLASVPYLSHPPQTDGQTDRPNAVLPLLDRTVLGELPSQIINRRLQVIPNDGQWLRQQWKQRQRDWSRADGVAQASAVRRVLEMAKTPGLAGLLVRDMVAPGYFYDGTPPPYYGFDAGITEGGYTSGCRLDFLEKEGVDPVDILPPTSSIGQVTFDFSFFREPYTAPSGEAAQKPFRSRWQTFRHTKMLQALADLHKSLRKNVPGLTLYMQGLTENGDAGNWVGSWDKPNVLPHLTWMTDSAVPPTPIEKQAHQFSQLVLLIYPVGLTPLGQTKEFPRKKAVRDTRALLATAKGWNGVLFDATHENEIYAVEALADALTSAIGSSAK